MIERSAEGSCKEVRSLNTLYNTVDGVPPMVGLLFTITATTNVELLTFELGVVPNVTTSIEDLFVEVYAMKGEFFHPGDYLSYQSDPKLWTLLFQSNGALDPEGAGLLLSSEEFTSFSLDAGATFSFYITMKGPFLNCPAQALQKTGEVQVEGDDFAVTVGAGLSEYNFPESIDPTIDPQFSGRIYYRKKTDCFSATTLYYPFLFSQDVQLDEVMSPVVDQSISSFLSASASLMEMTHNGSLQLVVPSEITRDLYTGQCPNEWSRCPRVLFRAGVTVRHHESVDPSWLSFELYMADAYVTKALEDSLLGSRGYMDVEVAYIGYKSIEADFSLNLTTSLPVINVGGVDHDYVARVMASFLTDTVDSNLASNVYVVASSGIGGSGLQTDSETRNQQFAGQIRGTRFGYLGFDEFGQTLQEAFQTGEQLFIDMAATHALAPGEVSNSSQIFALQIQNMSIIVFPADGFSEPVLSGSSRSKRVAVIAACVMSALLIVFTILSAIVLRRMSLKHKTSCEKRVPAEAQLPTGLLEGGPEGKEEAGQLGEIVSRVLSQKRNNGEESNAATPVQPDAQGTATKKGPARFSSKNVMDLPRPPSTRNLESSNDPTTTYPVAMPAAANVTKSVKHPCRSTLSSRPAGSPPSSPPAGSLPSPRSAGAPPSPRSAGAPPSPRSAGAPPWPRSAGSPPSPRSAGAPLSSRSPPSTRSEGILSSPQLTPPSPHCPPSPRSADAPRSPRTTNGSPVATHKVSRAARPPPRTASSASATSTSSTRSPPAATGVVPGVPSRWLDQ